jgi:MerR family transcriptional regulator, copper efflux regulator
MGRDGLLIGEMAQRSGVTRKALRLYEEAKILPAARRTASGYRLYAADALAVLSFVRKAQGLGFTLAEIKDIVAIRRSGRAPCPHVCDLVRRKAADLDRKARRPGGGPARPEEAAERLAVVGRRTRDRVPPHRAGQPKEEERWKP